MITAVTTFDFQLRTRIVFGNGVIGQLGALAGQLGARGVLLVSDPGVVRAGLALATRPPTRSDLPATKKTTCAAKNPAQPTQPSDRINS
jgi:alcohol dehydrogenase class IV